MLPLAHVHNNSYTCSLRGVHQAVEQLNAARISYLRPTDYFAEMIKPDQQMNKIKDTLLRERYVLWVVWVSAFV